MADFNFDAAGHLEEEFCTERLHQHNHGEADAVQHEPVLCILGDEIIDREAGHERGDIVKDRDPGHDDEEVDELLLQRLRKPEKSGPGIGREVLAVVDIFTLTHASSSRYARWIS